MSRTIRRKHYVPAWVTEQWEFDYFNPRTGTTIYWGHRKLEGDELAEKLRWWHEDKSCYWGTRPPTYYRKKHEDRHRSSCRREVVRAMRDPEYPVQLERKAKLGYWN